MTGFIITWKEEHWDHKNIQAMIQTLQTVGYVEQLWRIGAYRQASVGDHAFLLKQGSEPKGMFGYGRLLDRPSQRIDLTDPGVVRWRANVRFELLGDPLKGEFLIPFSELQTVLSLNELNAQSSGQSSLPSETVDWLLGRLSDQTVQSPRGSETGPGIAGITTGPVPTSWSGKVNHDANVACKTYAMRFGASMLWKIGLAVDLAARLEEVNKHVPVELIGQQWSLARKQVWPTSEAAYEMEQAVLQSLAAKRTQGERVRCTPDELDAAWANAYAQLKRK